MTTFTDDQIRAFINSNISNPMSIYNAAMQYGISPSRIDAIMGWSSGTAQKWVDDNAVKLVSDLDTIVADITPTTTVLPPDTQFPTLTNPTDGMLKPSTIVPTIPDDLIVDGVINPVYEPDPGGGVSDDVVVGGEGTFDIILPGGDDIVGTGIPTPTITPPTNPITPTTPKVPTLPELPTIIVKTPEIKMPDFSGLTSALTTFMQAQTTPKMVSSSNKQSNLINKKGITLSDEDLDKRRATVSSSYLGTRRLRTNKKG